MKLKLNTILIKRILLALVFSVNVNIICDLANNHDLILCFFSLGGLSLGFYLLLFRSLEIVFGKILVLFVLFIPIRMVLGAIVGLVGFLFNATDFPLDLTRYDSHYKLLTDNYEENEGSPKYKYYVKSNVDINGLIIRGNYNNFHGGKIVKDKSSKFILVNKDEYEYTDILIRDCTSKEAAYAYGYSSLDKNDGQINYLLLPIKYLWEFMLKLGLFTIVCSIPLYVYVKMVFEE